MLAYENNKDLIKTRVLCLKTYILYDSLWNVLEF